MKYILTILTLIFIMAFIPKPDQPFTTLSFTTIPFTDPEISTSGRGIHHWFGNDNWNNSSTVQCPNGTLKGKNIYYRLNWAQIENAGSGTTPGTPRYNWAVFDTNFNRAIRDGMQINFGILTISAGYAPFGSPGGFDLSYPTYLHNQMQAEATNSKDWGDISEDMWIPNWNSPNYLAALEALNEAIATHIATTSHQGVDYADVIGYIDIRGYGHFGEWHNSGYAFDQPTGRVATVQTLKDIVDIHVAAFPNYPLVILSDAFSDGGSALNPNEVTAYLLNGSNTWGKFGWIRDNWGQDLQDDILINNPDSYGGMDFDTAITNRYKYAPVSGEPSNNGGAVTYAGVPYGHLPAQIQRYHAMGFGNGNYSGGTTSAQSRDSIRMASKWAGHRLVLTGGSISTNLFSNTSFNLSLDWKNVGLCAPYHDWRVDYELRTSANVLVTTWTSAFEPKLFNPLASSTTSSENFTMPAVTGAHKIMMIVRDPLGYRLPLHLAITGRESDGAYEIASFTVQASSVNTKVLTIAAADAVAMNGGTRGNVRAPWKFVDGNTSTQICVGGAGDGIYFPQYMMYKLDSAYNTVKIRVNTGSGSPNIQITLFDETFANSLTLATVVGGFNVWNWIDTTVSKAWSFNTRWIQIYMPSCIALREMEVTAVSTGLTPVEHFPNNTSILNTAYTDYHGGNVNGDEPDSTMMAWWYIRENSAAFYFDTATVGITPTTHKQIFSMFNNRYTKWAGLRDSLRKVFFYTSGASAANMHIAHPYNSSLPDQYGYYVNQQKNVVWGSDSTNPVNWQSAARIHGAAAGYFGNNESANMFGYTVTLGGGGSPTPGSNVLIGSENINEGRRDWAGDTAHHSNQVVVASMSPTFDTAHSKDAGYLVIQGAHYIPDTNDAKAQSIYAYRLRGFNNYPADVYAFNHYITDAGGQSQAPTYGVTPERGQFYEEMVAYRTVVRKYIGAKKIWHTEVGWDASPNSAYRSKTIGAKSSRKVSADWLVRTYLIGRAAGLDGMYHYRLRDETNNQTSAASFATMGLITGYNPNPDSSFKKWPSWYGMNTLRVHYSRYVGPPTIVQRQDSTGIWILKDDPESGDSVTTETMWMPTGDGSDTTITRNIGSAFKWIRRTDFNYGTADLQTGDPDGVTSIIISSGNSITLTVGETPVIIQYILGANTAPVSNAGADQNTAITSVTLNGSGSSDNVGIISYLWEKISGTGGTIATPTTVSTSVTGLSVGTYVFRLTVTDDAGAQHTDNVTVTISAAGPVYYIDTAGNDTNDGLTISTPWKTIAKINASTFSPGDFILFKRDQMWREQLIIPSSGTAGNLITFGAYGTGEKPIINGADITTGWTTSATNVWWVNNPNATTTRAMVIIDGVIYAEVASVALVNSANEYFIDVTATPDRLYVFSTTDPDNLVAEVSKRNYGFIARDQDDRHHCAFVGLEFRYAGTTGLQLEGEYQGPQVPGNFVVDSCFFYANRAAGCDAHDGVTDNVFKNSVATYNGNGFYAWISDNVTMQNCSTAHNINYQSISLFTDGHGFGVYAGDNFIIENCESNDDAGGVVIDAGNAANGGIIRYNYLHNSTTFHPGISTGNLAAGDTIEIYYNLVVNCGGATGTGMEDYLINTGTTLVYNNTFYNNASNGGNSTIYFTYGNNMVFKNNIVFSERGGDKTLLFNQYANLLTSDYNQWFQLDSVGSPNRFYYNGTYRATLANWQAGVSQDLNSQSGDPLFVNKASDWTLQATSPAINKGVNVGLTVDFDGNPIIGLPDMGAFEFSQTILQKIKTRFKIKRN